MITPDGALIPRNTNQRAQRAEAQRRAKNKKQPNQKRGMGERPFHQALIPAPVMRINVAGVPAARTLVSGLPNGLECVSGTLALAAADATRGGNIFTILISPRNVDPSESLRALEFYRGRLGGPIRVTYEPCSGIVTPGFITTRWVPLPGVGYAEPTKDTKVALDQHAALARACSGAARARLTDGFSIQWRPSADWQAEVENDVVEMVGEVAQPHCSESFRLDHGVLLLEVTLNDVPASVLTGDTPIGTILVQFPYSYSGRHPPGVDA